MKKIITIMLATMMMLSLSCESFAKTVEENNTNTVKDEVTVCEVEGKGISINPPIVDERGTSIPKKVYNVAEKGSYTFSGESEYQTLYTEYCFTGQDDYTIVIYNEGEHDINVKCKTRFHTFSNNTVAPGSSSEFSLASVGKDTEFYIRFAGSLMKFSGSVA